MVTDILITTFTWILNGIVFILPQWTIYPQAFTDGLQYFFTSLVKFNFFFPIDTLLTALIFFVHFEVLYYTAKLIMGGISMLRGSGEIKL